MALLDDIVTFFTGGNKQPAKTETPRRTTDRPAPSRPESFYRTPTPAAREEQRFTPPTLSRGGGRGGMVAMSAPTRPAENTPPKNDFWGNVFGGLNTGASTAAKAVGDYWRSGEDKAQERSEYLRSAQGLGAQGLTYEQLKNSPGLDKAIEAKKEADFSVAEPRTFGIGSERGTKQLSQSEWNALSTDQQKAVMVNWALYQAAAKDRENANNGDKPDDLYKKTVSDMFGDKLDSSTYAPNVIKVLSDLGYKSDNVDLDDIIQGRTMASYADIAGGANPNTERQALSGALSSQAFNSESVVGALQKGANLLDAVANDGSIGFREFLPQSPYANLAGQDFDDLAALGKNLSHRGFVERLKSDPALSAEVTSQIDEANSRFGPGVLSQYLLDMLRSNQDTGAFLTEDEFRKTWLGE